MFDRYVAQTRPSWKRRALIFVALGIEGLFFVVLFIYSIIHIEEIAPPALSLTFFSAAPPPPPPPPPPKASTPHVEKKTPKVTPTQVVQPTDVKPIIQPKQEEKEEEDDGEEGGVEGGVKGGVKGGVVGGVIGGVVGGTVGGAGTGNAPAAAPKMVASITLLASQLSHPDPHLPDFFRNQHPNQVVRGVYKVCLRQDGRVSDVYPMTSIPGVDAIIIEQVKASWTYKPQPVPVCFASAITFKIN
jgi:periplasmic protein TonB